jgi:2-dehydro-3-deoxyphosphogluconate aldolase/(4S)-4-hydroxy-2-oxoglutarate aldolase
LAHRQNIIEEIGMRRASAIIRASDTDLARDAMAAVVRGGFRIIEFTMTTPGALELIREFSSNQDLLVGAGTVLTPGQGEDAVKAGARFLVSPVVDPEVISKARELDVVSVPGTFTPNEMMAADQAGADIVKLFPAPANVTRYVTQIRGPLPHLRIFPTAGVDEENFEAVLAAGAFGVGFVSSLFCPADMERRDFQSIEERAGRIIRKLHTLG